MAERQQQARLHQAHQAAAQQRYRAQAAAQQAMAAQHEAVLREATERAGGTKPPLSNKEKKRLQKQQRREKEARAKALSQARKASGSRSSTFQRTRGAVTPKRGLLRKIFSVKGALLLLPVGYLYVSHRGLLASLTGVTVKYPALLFVWMLKTIWRLALKPTAGFLLKLSRGGGTQLPGGAY